MPWLHIGVILHQSQGSVVAFVMVADALVASGVCRDGMVSLHYGAINATPTNALVALGLDGLVCLFVTVEVALVALGGSLTLRLLHSCQQHCLSATNLKICSY